MTAKKNTTRRPRATVTKQDQFTGLAGAWKQVAQFGEKMRND